MDNDAMRFEIEVGLPEADGAQAGTQLPFRILVLADLAGSAEGTVDGALAGSEVELTADNFDAVMAAAAPSLTLKTTDPTQPGSVMVELPLRFDSLRSFQPTNLLEQIPEAKALMGIREHLVDRMRCKWNADQLSRALAAAGVPGKMEWLVEALKWSPTAKPAAAPEKVDALLDQLDLGDGAESAVERPKTPIGAIVAAAAGGNSVPAEEASAIRRALVETDRRISNWINTVLHAPAVQAIEAAWRSLAFLVSHTDFRKGVRIAILHAHRDQLAERFRTLIIDPVFDAGAAAPDAIIADYPFGNTAPDLEMLDELAQHAGSLPAVVIASISPGFLGVKQAWQVATLPGIMAMFDQWQFAKWKSLRGESYSRFLGVVLGRCLLRGPYGREQLSDLQYNYREECLSDKDLIWAGGAVAAACTISQSVCDTGWPTAMAGYVHGRIEGFHSTQGGPKGDKKFGPTDIQMPQNKVEEFAVAGINVAGGLRDIDDAVVWNGLTAARPRRTDQDAFLEVSLPYQLFAARLSALLFAIKPHLAGKSSEQVVAYVRTHLCHWLKLEADAAPEQLMVQTRPLDEDPTALQLAVTVTPPQSILPGGIPVVMGYRLN